MQSTFDTQKSELQALFREEWEKRAIRVIVKRDDKIHEEVSGNKWRKLKYHLLQAQHEKKQGILTFGGAYSNHLLATASACHQLKLNSIGIVRGEELTGESNQTLRRCQELGMKLEFVSREEYNLRNDYDYRRELAYEHPGFYIVPEGGASWWGMVGCQEIWRELPPADHLFLALGTGTTAAGLLFGAPDQTRVNAVPVLKGFDVHQEIKNLCARSGMELEDVEEQFKQLIIHDKYHFGGYGKVSDELLQFMIQVENEFQLPLDKVYTAKAFWAMCAELQKPDYDGKTIVFLHTGGLQGNQ